MNLVAQALLPVTLSWYPTKNVEHSRPRLWLFAFQIPAITALKAIFGPRSLSANIRVNPR
jgi:hypothetical protein